jgi:hypothetical protein
MYWEPDGPEAELMHRATRFRPGSGAADAVTTLVFRKDQTSGKPF